MADKKPGRGGHGAPKKKGKKPPKAVETTVSVARKSNKRERALNRRRMYDGKMVTPVKYCGSCVGHGNYTAGMVNGETVRDDAGKPIPWREFTLEPRAVVDF